MEWNPISSSFLCVFAELSGNMRPLCLPAHLYGAREEEKKAKCVCHVVLLCSYWNGKERRGCPVLE